MSLIVEVKQGLIEGMYNQNKDVRIFKGIPYAKAPVGNLRFKRPQPKGKWIGIRPCKSFSPKAYQVDQTKGDLYPKEFYSGDLPPMSEDCLYLNIWTPKVIKEKLPVLFWIHGGAFMHGYGSEIEFDGENLAKKDIIVVSINYRTGALGFLVNDELDKENKEGISGNYGIFDQIAALDWVYDNIEAFGGDKDKITIAGQSAGCMSCQILVSSLLTKGKIHGVIFQSAAGLPGFAGNHTKEEVKEVSNELMKLVNASSIEALREKEPEDICYGSYEVMSKRGGLWFTPHVDGYLLQQDPSDVVINESLIDIPMMIGSTTQELGGGTGELLEKGTVEFAKKVSEYHTNPVYVYHFERELPGSNDGAFHSSELWYEFATLDKCWRPFEQKDYEISKEMSEHFVNFIKTGNPNGKDVREWKPCDNNEEFRMIYK